MFIAHESTRRPTSQLFAHYGESHFSAVELAIDAIWFVVTSTETESIEGETYKLQRTWLLSHPLQLRTFLEAGNEVNDILIVTPSYANGSDGWRMDRLSRVWHANEPDDNVANTYVFETSTGRRFSNSAARTPVEDMVVGSMFLQMPTKADFAESSTPCL